MDPDKPKEPGKPLPTPRQALEFLDAHPELEELFTLPPEGSFPTTLVIRVHSLSDQIYTLEDDDGWQRHVRHDIQSASL